jgi:hypothetical protein
MSPIKHKGRPSTPWKVFAPPGYDGAETRKPYYFATQQAAKDFCKSLEKWQSSRKGRVVANIVTDADHGWLQYLRNELPSLSIIPEVVTHWKKTAAIVTQKISVLDLCEQFMAHKQGAGLAPNTLAEIRSKLKAFSSAFGNHPAFEISPVQMRDYLLTLPSGWTRKGHYKWLRNMFEFAEQQKIVSESPMRSLKAPPRSFSDIQIYSIEDIEKLLKTADSEFPELLPWLAICAFNFTRTCELVPIYAGDTVLNWSEVLFELQEPFIRIRGEVAKQTRRDSGCARDIPLQESTAHWIYPCKLASGSVMPFATERRFQIAKKLLFQNAGVEPISNGLRHSCLSYFIAANQATGIALTAQYAGNSEQVSRSFYIKSLPPSEGRRYLSIRRP